MLPNNRNNWWKPYAFLAIVFALVISVNFTKPFGFFRESNPALVAINAVFWAQHPDTRHQHIPIASYAFDEHQSPATQFDNTITTFGFAWFSVPYYFLQLTHIPIGPVGLRIFSLIWLLFTLTAIYRLSMYLARHSSMDRLRTFLSIAFYVLSPVVLWYQVNGYVHETAVLPFYYWSWYFFLRLMEEKRNKWLWLAAAGLLIGIQFDWLSFFQGAVMGIYLLFNRKGLPRWMCIVPGIAVFTGIIYIIYTYTSWSSLEDYFGFMRWKFGSRTVGQEGHSFLSFWPVRLNIVLFYIISYGLLLLWSLIGLIRRKQHPLLWLMIITAIFHHIVFWGFSSEHDYAALKMGFPLVFIAATWVVTLRKRSRIMATASVIVLSIAQYFILHNYSFRKGMYGDEGFFVKAGQMIKAQPEDVMVIVNTENKYFPQLEFYAGRPYKIAESAADAKVVLLTDSMQTKAVFIDVMADSSVTITR